MEGETRVLKCLHEALAAHKTCYLPILTKEGLLQFGTYQANTPLIKNKYEIDEPQTTQFLPAPQLDAVLLPLVAFDNQGNRLGMGKGYYDKTFAFKTKGTPPILIGVAHDCQKADNIPTDSWDISLDFILTESGIYPT
jgi:5-formyltetrahydrofolate cyclo-ligase